jgi:hypothetical protein
MGRLILAFVITIWGAGLGVVMFGAGVRHILRHFSQA